MESLWDTIAVAEFMTGSGQPVRTSPTTDITDQERILRVKLVIEEALEFAEAMGCEITPDESGVLRPKSAVVTPIAGQGIDLVEAADAISDLIVVTKGSAHTLGIPVDQVTEAVHVTNMAKIAEPVRRNSDGKILKPEGWVPPTEKIAAILSDASV